MGGLAIFVIRVVLGAVFAVVLVRIFYPATNIMYVIGLAVFLVGLAYFFEYLRKNKKKK